MRELAAVIERAAILGHARKLEVAAALGVGGVPAPVRRAAPQEPTVAADTNTAPVRFDDIVVAHIERVLAETRGRIEGPKGAAAALGVNPHTLRARMRKLGLDWSRFRAT